MNRRKVLSWFGLGWLVSFLPASLIGCSENNSPNASSTASVPESVDAAPSGKFKAIGTVAKLDQDGQLVFDKIAVVRDPQDSKKLVAVSTTCTHNGCTVKWKSANKEFICPCHDAKFAANGSVRKGPAQKSLQRYAAKIEKGEVLISV